MSEPPVIGTAPNFKSLLRIVDLVAPTNRAVLICGPTGAGKEVIARLIHRLSSNPDTPFIDINCGSIPEHLIEAEFFGHTKGAFTGAVANRVGYFELAGAGTLFLDEIGELPLSLQPKLLRVLEMRTFRPVGSTEVRHFRGRIVAATHRDLQALVASNTFREDLYYRLANFVLDIPGLDQRREDIPALVSHFVSLQARQISFTAEAMEYLCQHAWPGNVRELRSLIDRLAVLSDTPRITTEVLTAFLAPSHPVFSLETLADELLKLKGANKLEAAERLLIDRAMQLCGGNKSAAANLLGVGRKSVERRHAVREDKATLAQRYLNDARRLVEQSAFSEAIPILERALETLVSVADQDEYRLLHFELHRLRGVSYRSIYGWLDTHAMHSYETALKLGYQLGDMVDLGSLLFGFWTAQLMSLQLGKARATAQEMLQRSQAGGNANAIGEAHLAMANTLFWLGDNEEVLACLQRGGLLPENGDERIGAQGFDIIGLAMTLEGLTLFQTGSFQRARASMEKLRLRGEREGALTFNRVISLQGAAWLACLFEDAEQLGPLATMLESIARIHGYAFYQGIGKFFIGQHLVFQNAFDEAEHHMHDGYENYMLRDGGKLFHSFQARKRGELMLLAGRPEESDALVSEALDIAIQSNERAYLVELQIAKAKAKQAMGDLNGAEHGLRNALSTAQVLGSIPPRIDAATSLAHLLRDSGRQHEALNIVKEALREVEQSTPFPTLIRAWEVQQELQLVITEVSDKGEKYGI